MYFKPSQSFTNASHSNTAYLVVRTDENRQYGIFAEEFRAEMHTYRQADRQTDRQIDKQTGR